MLADLARIAATDPPEFEVYEQFEHPDETAWWFRQWTGNQEADGGEFRFFGMEGAGGYVGLWLAREGRPLTEQPVVFLGSEGQTAVMAADLASFLWLLAQGIGPWEAVDGGEPEGVDPGAVAIAERHAPDSRRPWQEILRLAREEFPDFEGYIDEQCR